MTGGQVVRNMVAHRLEVNLKGIVQDYLGLRVQLLSLLVYCGHIMATCVRSKRIEATQVIS
jgi:hypothetical protein